MDSIVYTDAKNRIVRALARITLFVKASTDYEKDTSNVAKRAKVGQMLCEINEIRRCVETDIQLMETAVAQNTAPLDVTDNTCSCSLIDSFDTLYYDLAAFADVHNISLFPKTDVSKVNVTTVNNSMGYNNLSMVQLPKRKFPTFSGNITEWQGFEDLFQSIISHAPTLPDVERFEYLKTSLSGEALSLISHLALTAANYTSAWAILRARYGNKRDLARVHLDALLTPYEIKGNDAQSIKTMINTILEHTSALDNLQFLTRQWSPILIHIFEKYLDYNLRARWEQFVGDRHNPQIDEFIEFLRSHVRAAEVHSLRTISTRSTMKPQISSPISNSKPRQNFQQKVMTTATSHVNNVSCPLCKRSHPIRRCEVFSNNSPNERFNLIKTHRLCINCLGSGHSAATCPSKYRCQTCNRSHHSLLHFGTPPSKSENSASTSLMSSESPSPSTTSLIVRGHSQNIVLLSTVRVNVLSATEKRHTLRALLDSGAQASFITDKAIQTLMLPRQHSSVNINTFASTSSSRVRGKSTISLSPHNQLTPTFSLDVLIVPTITGPSPSVQITTGHWSHIQNLNLADPLYNIPGSIDLLLGADIVPSILQSGQR